MKIKLCIPEFVLEDIVSAVVKQCAIPMADDGVVAVESAPGAKKDVEMILLKWGIACE